MARPSSVLSATDAGLRAWSANYRDLHIDIGTGDGRFPLHLARREPERGVIGLDTCLDHLAVHPRRTPENLRFICADERAIPPELDGRATSLTINFPYSSLLKGLLTADDALLANLAATLAPGGDVAIRINARALAETGMTLDEAGRQVERACRVAGLGRITTTALEGEALRRFPSTWAKRIGFGRQPRAVQISARSSSSEAGVMARSLATALTATPAIEPHRR